MAVSEAGSKSNILDSLGVDWKLLLIQLVAFLLLVALLGKFVYPILIKAIDKRQAELDAGIKASQDAEKKAAAGKAEIAELLKQARDEAAEIVVTAREEATSVIESADQKARHRAEAIVTEARDQLARDVAQARTQLYNDTLELVAQATERVAGEAISQDVDKKLIARAIEEVRS